MGGATSTVTLVSTDSLYFWNFGLPNARGRRFVSVQVHPVDFDVCRSRTPPNTTIALFGGVEDKKEKQESDQKKLDSESLSIRESLLAFDCNRLDSPFLHYHDNTVISFKWYYAEGKTVSSQEWILADVIRGPAAKHVDPHGCDSRSRLGLIPHPNASLSSDACLTLCEHGRRIVQIWGWCSVKISPH